jgi:multiple sugar transport system substrate-binding protein
MVMKVNRRSHPRTRASLQVLIAIGGMTVAAIEPFSQAGATKAATSPINATMWDTATGTQSTGLLAGVKAFNASQTKYHITPQYIAVNGTNPAAVTAKLATALTSNSGPDLFWADYEPSYIGQLISTGDVVPLTSFMNTPTDGLSASAFNPAMLGTGTVKGTVYAVPVDGGDYAVFYNKKLFAEAGITSTPTTWGQLAADSKKISKNGVYGYYVNFGEGESASYPWESLLWAAGGQFLNANDTKAEFDSPQGIAALQIWINLVKNHEAYPSALNNGVETEGAPGYQSGKVAMYLDGSYDLEANDQALGKANVGVFPFPAIKTEAINVGTDVSFVLKSSPAVEQASWAFIHYMLTPIPAAKYDATAGFLPTIKAAGNTAIYKAYVSSDSRLKVFLQELAFGHARPSISAYPEISNDLATELNEAYLGKISAAQALKVAAAESDQALASSSSSS